MEKVICDVCGTDYPETAAQCPICGCARGDGGQTSAGNTTAEERPYTYTKGGHFSKTNVRKRLKAAQKQSVPVVMPAQEPEDDEDEEYDEQEEGGSNRGLIAIVILLLLAIIALSSYIAIVHFDLLGSNDATVPVGTTSATQATQTDPTSGGVQVPCTGLTVTDTEINLVAKDSVWQLSFAVEPLDTTEQVKFQSSNENVATVDASGRVTAIGGGEATITITCGSFSSECVVKCSFGSTVEPSTPTDPSVPSDPSVPDVVLKLNRTDFTLSRKGESWKLYSGELDPAEITWTSNNEDVVTVENGKVVAVGVGRTQVVAEYQGQKATCWVSCSWQEEEPADPTDPVDPSDPSDEPAETYFMKVNNVDPHYVTGTDACEVSITVGEVFVLTVVDDMEARMNVEWIMSVEGIVTISGRNITGASAGKVTLTTTYGDQTFTCVILVNA